MLRSRTRWLIGWMVLSAMVLLLAGTAAAEEPVTALHTDPYWKAEYWSNPTLSGSPILQRNDVTLDFDWGAGSPDANVPANGFSARWTRYIDGPASTYRFTATSDDGIRVWVDGQLIINKWYDHAAETVSAERTLNAGHHLVVVEYYENAGLAVAKVTWDRVYLNWRGEYFNNRDLSGSPALVREDANINFNWGYGSPAEGTIGVDNFSVRWTRSVDLPAGYYHFEVTVDDGVRLWVNGHHLTEAWFDGAARTYTNDMYLPGGPIPMIMEYYEHDLVASAQLVWYKTDSSPGPAPTPPSGTVIVDDTDPGFVKGGSATGWRTQPEGYGGHLTWTLNNDWARPNFNWGRWYPTLSAGWYEVFVYIPERYTTTSSARYWISHADGYTLRVVNQSTTGSQWVSLGTYRFRGADADYVSLSDVTYENRLSRLIAWDAMKWEPR